MKKTISELLRYLKIPVSSSYCEQLIASHPDYPSLLSIVDTLNRLGIPNTAARVDKERLPELVFPYVLQLATKHGDIITVKSPRDLTKNKERLESWNGIVLHVESTNEITDPENQKHYKRERLFSALIYLSAIVLAIPFAWSALTAFSVITGSIFTLSIAGLVVGYLLIAKDIGIKFDVVESFCTPVGKRNDCDRVLESEGASLFGGIKLSDMVFSYFLCQVLWFASLAAIPAWRAQVTQVLSVVSIVAIPAVVYSVVYQLKIKTWCKLCLIVDGVLLVQAALFATTLEGQFNSWDTTVVGVIGGGSLVIASLVILFKGRIENIHELRIAASDAARVKSSPAVFGYLSSQQEKEVKYKSPLHFISGDPDAPLRLVMVSNLFCKPCADQHKIVENLVDMFPGYLAVEFRFITAKERDVTPNSNQYLIEYWMRNIRGFDNEAQRLKQMMLDWYEYMDFEKFRKQYPMENDTPSEECVAMEKAHVEWAERQGITRTPTLFLNGTMLPKQYLAADLAPLVQSLSAEVIKAKESATVPQEDIQDLV